MHETSSNSPHFPETYPTATSSAPAQGAARTTTVRIRPGPRYIEIRPLPRIVMIRIIMREQRKLRALRRRGRKVLSVDVLVFLRHVALGGAAHARDSGDGVVGERRSMRKGVGWRAMEACSCTSPARRRDRGQGWVGLVRENANVAAVVGV